MKKVKTVKIGHNSFEEGVSPSIGVTFLMTGLLFLIIHMFCLKFIGFDKKMNKILNKNLPRVLLSYNKYAIHNFSNEMIFGRHLAPVSEWQTVLKRFAGHSKWQNIKHTKLSKDAEKSRLINKLMLKLRFSLRNVGGTDPKINREFGDVMEMCRKANIPNTTIDKAIKRALEKKFIPLKMEILGPNGTLLVLDAEAENKSTLKHAVKGVLKKYKGFAFAEEGRALFAFEEKGIVRIKDKDKDGKQIDLERAEEVAIEADAEEVKPNPEDDSVLLFVTETQNCHKTKKYIEENTNFEIIDSGIELVPYQRIDLPEDALQVVVTAIEELEDLEEINKIYNNIN